MTDNVTPTRRPLAAITQKKYDQAIERLTRAGIDLCDTDAVFVHLKNLGIGDSSTKLYLTAISNKLGTETPQIYKDTMRDLMKGVTKSKKEDDQVMVSEQKEQYVPPDPVVNTNHGRRWTPTDDEELLQLISSGKKTSECAATLGRTEASIEGRKLRYTKEFIARGLSVTEASERAQLSPVWVEKYLLPAEEDSDDYLERISAPPQPVKEDDRYKNAKIYELVHEGNVIYRGSTIQSLEYRLKGHQSSTGHGRISDYIKKVGPQNISIRLVELYPCKNHAELLSRETYLIQEEKANSNLLNVKHNIRYVETETFTKILNSK